MKGLIFNLLAELARQSECEEDAWQLALAVSEEVADELALEEEREDEELMSLLVEASLQGGADFTFRWLLRSASPFRDEDWSDLGDPSSLSHASEAPESLFFGLDATVRRRSNRE